MARVVVAVFVVSLFWQHDGGAADSPSVSSSVSSTFARGFLDTYCLDCHNDADAGGERDFESLSLADQNLDTLIDMQDIVDQLTLGEMPPSDAEQPSVKDRQAAIKHLTTLIRQNRQSMQSTRRQTVLRRLNRREYLQTIGDLFAIDMTMFDPTVLFPADATVDHLDNVGDALVTSGFLLEQYLSAADQIVAKVFSPPADITEQTWTFRDNFYQQPELNSAHKGAFDQRFLCLYDNPLAERPEGAYGPLYEFESGVPADGRYEIRVLAQALHRDTPFAERVLRMELDEPFRMGVVPGKTSVSELHLMQPIQPLLAEAIVPDDQPTWLTFEVPLDRGYTPRFTFENGHQDARGSYSRIMKAYRDELPKDAQKAKGISDMRKAVLKYADYPQIRIHEVQIRGPLNHSYPTASMRAVLGDKPYQETRTEELLRRFASRAYRRDVRDAELNNLMSLYRSRCGSDPADQTSQSSIKAFQDAIKLVLCSPAFLYFEPVEDKEGNISNTGLASRLSYFLTGSMPDEELMRLARNGQIQNPDVLRQQTRRLLAGDASDRFVNGFLDSWLNLRTLGDMPPDRNLFEEYYYKNLKADMRQETFLMMRHLLDENRPATDFLACDYTFLNRDLAELYGLADQVPADQGHWFRKVSLDGTWRGGLLGQASVLTVTANGIETSPIIRGVWLLENILGTPPAPPPDDVPAIDPDVRGAKSIRDLIEKHRQSPACNECHRKIDPLGFALESFDAIGRRRARYENGSSIDSSGTLPSGQSFQNVQGLKQALVKRKPFFARMLIEKLMAYGLGRRLEPADRGHVEEIREALADQDYPLGTVVEEIVQSELFRSR